MGQKANPTSLRLVINGTQPKLLNLRKLLRERFPYSWEEQKRELGFI